MSENIVYMAEAKGVENQTTFHTPGTILVTPQGIPYQLVSGQGWLRVEDKEWQRILISQNPAAS